MLKYIRFKKTNIKNNNSISPSLSLSNIFVLDKIKWSTKLSSIYEVITDAIIETKNNAYNFDFIIFTNALPNGILQIKL